MDLQKSRAHQAVDAATVATYTAARAFLIAAWAGALLMVYSFTHLYLFGLRPGADVASAAWWAGAMMVLGTAVWARSRAIYLGLDFPWRRRLEVVASLLAATAGLFWLLFLLAAFLTWRGVELL